MLIWMSFYSDALLGSVDDDGFIYAGPSFIDGNGIYVKFYEIHDSPYRFHEANIILEGGYALMPTLPEAKQIIAASWDKKCSNLRDGFNKFGLLGFHTRGYRFDCDSIIRYAYRPGSERYGRLVPLKNVDKAHIVTIKTAAAYNRAPRYETL